MTDSPFLPGTKIQYAWDSTSLGELKTCPRKYQYTIIDGWVPKGESIHLRFGQEYHSALQQYDILRAQGIKHERAIHETIAALMVRTAAWDVDTTTKVGKYKNRSSLIQLTLDYFDHFGAEDPANTYIRENGQPAVELSFRFELDFGPKAADEDEAICRAREQGNLGEVTHINQPYLLCGHLDRVVEFNNALMVMDHKTTTTTLGSRWFDQWDPNNQMSLYTLAGKIILNAPIRGVVICGAQILIEEPNRFVRGFTYRTQDQLDEWLSDLSVLLRTAETYAEANYWPMNDTACDKFGGCKFRDVCSKSPAVREKFLAADFTQLSEEERWNPLKPR